MPFNTLPSLIDPYISDELFISGRISEFIENVRNKSLNNNL